VPRHLQTESGFESVSSLGDEDSSKRQQSLEDAATEARRQRQRVSDRLDQVVSYMEDKKKASVSTTAIHQSIRQVTEYSQMIQDETVLDTMSPDSRRLYVDTIKTERKRVLEEMHAGSNADEN